LEKVAYIKKAEPRKPETLLTPKHEEKFNELLRSPHRVVLFDKLRTAESLM